MASIAGKSDQYPMRTLNSRYGSTRVWKKSTLFECQCIKHESTNCGHYFYVSYWRPDRHFTWSSEPREGLAVRRTKEIPSFLSYFKTLSIGPATGIEPATSRSAVKRSIDWAKPAAVNCTERSGIVRRHEIHPRLKDGRSSWIICCHASHLFDLQEQLSSLNVRKNHRSVLLVGTLL